MKTLKRNLFTVILALGFCFITPMLKAQHDTHQDHDTEHHDDHHIQPNHLAVFVGSTTNFDHHSTDLTIGLDYEHRFEAKHGLFGLGLFGEYVATESGEIIAGIPVFIHPAAGFKIVVSPIMVFAEDHHTHKNEMNFGGRLGAGYDFHLGMLSVGPSINLDYSNTIALNYGLTIGLGF